MAATMFRTAWRLRVFGTISAPAQVRFVTSPSSSDTVRQGIDELKKTESQMKDKAATHVGFAASRSKEAGGATENVAEKAKETAKEAWNATRDAAEKVQSTVAGKANASAATVKENIQVTKSSMNTKN